MKPAIKQIQSGSICILGIPFDQNSSFRKGPALAPERIRESYFSSASNLWSEKGLNLESINHLYDLGDINFKDNTDAFNIITTSVKTALDLNCHVICLGGDHSITLPVIEAYAQKYDCLNILDLDAHPDLYDTLDDNRYSHACPFARIMEKKLATRLVQAGIRTMNGHQREQAQKFGVEVNEMKDNNNWLDELEFKGPVYLSIDLDCLDPAFAPGVSHHEPGGMTTRNIIDIVHHLKGNLIGADIVEYNPDRDIHSMTSVVAAKLLKEIIARIYEDIV
ncbi:MAG: agmatinase [Proteobacteria bacterium]|nr:agmatinase [Pseudomonadota bacterium]MBU1584769.1 agmatinase [Pseudomonadota bacterium]MBU2455217.1 agmatinase [Pseudomonadota bacterium]MBU2631562.1 agmatinase [Pseudomonadota bacterium]